MEKNLIKKIINTTRPDAKFVNVSHSDEFSGKLPFLKGGFYYVGLYDEKIDSAFNTITQRGKNYHYIINNTYLSSFAYNLIISYILSNNEKLNLKEDLRPRIKYNFKKFFAEQLLHFHNSCFSRAVLLETLLYEQDIMIPIFEAASKDKEINNRIMLAASIMSSLVSFHELGHYVLNQTDLTWDDVIKESPSTTGKLFEQIKNHYDSSFIEEFKCDVLSIYSCISEFQSLVEKGFLLNTIIFGFSSYTTMWSLVKSAKATSNQHKQINEVVKFDSIKRAERNYDFNIGVDTQFMERTKLIIRLCEYIAEKEGLKIYLENETFPIPESILKEQLQFIDEIMINPDLNARNMSMLVAESLHNHPKGIEYLYLKSKVFTNQGTQIEEL